jgi:hypothetical protein
VALALLTAASWLGLGTFVLAPLSGAHDRGLELLNRIGAGAIAFALLTFAAGLAGLLYREAYLLLFVPAATIGLVVAARELRRAQRPRFRDWPRWQLALAGLVGLYVVVGLVVTCAPVSSADALLHHAAAPELYARTHEFRELAWSWNSYQPYTVEMLVLDGILLHDVEQGAFAPFLLGVGALAVATSAAYRLLGRSGAVLAAAILYAQPFTAWITTSTFVEPGTAFFLALAAWNVAEFVRRSPDVSRLVAAGVFAGGTAGTKYFGAAAVAIFALAGAVLLRERLSLRRFAAVAVPAMLVAAPWYVKNAILTGDPVYPILRGWPNDDARRAAYESIESYGHGTTPLDLGLLPVRLLGDADAFDRGEFLSPLVLLFAPLALLLGRARGATIAALAASAGFVVLWFYSVQHARYLFPLLPVGAVLAAAGAIALARSGALGRLVTVVAVAGSLTAGGAVTGLYAAQFLPYAVGLESRDEFLRENTPYYEGLEWLNANLPGDARVALDHVLVLHSDHPAVAWTADALPAGAGADETRAFFRRYRLTHAQVFAASAARRHQLDAIGAHVIGRVDARAVHSRTLSELGPPEPMLIYEVPPSVLRAQPAGTG